MAEQMRPASPEQAPDPSDNYERSHPEHESGQGRLDNNKSVPEAAPDAIGQAVKNKQPPRQINADDAASVARALPKQNADHSMKDEEPLGWDQAPTDIHDARQKRHPKTEGKGGTP